MTYRIHKTDGTILVNLTDKTKDTSSTSLALLGRGVVNYGTAVAENFVKLVENFHHNVAPENPLNGQIWVDKSTDTLKIYYGNAWVSGLSIKNGQASLAGLPGHAVAATPNTLSVRNGNGALVASAFHGVADTALQANNATTAGRAGIASDADLLNGFVSSVSSSNNTIARRDGSGALTASAFNGKATSATRADTAALADRATNADGATSAAALGGKLPSSAAGANTVAVRDASGALYATTFYGQFNGTFVGSTTGNASTSDHATTAGRANLADRATRADNADHATNADNATNATNAQNAQNAQNATNATNAQNAQNATNATAAQNAGNASKLDNKSPSTNKDGNTVAVRNGEGDLAVNRLYADGLELPHSVGIRGYVHLAGGMIEQWGYVSGPLSEGAVTVNFPVAFPGMCLNISGTIYNPQQNHQVHFTPQVVSMSASNAVIYIQREADSQGTCSGMFWRALGSTDAVSLSPITSTNGSGGGGGSTPSDGSSYITFYGPAAGSDMQDDFYSDQPNLNYNVGSGNGQVSSTVVQGNGEWEVWSGSNYTGTRIVVSSANRQYNITSFQGLGHVGSARRVGANAGGGSGGDGTYTGGGGSGGNCCWVEAYLPNGNQLKNTSVGDPLFLLNEEGTGYVDHKVEAMRWGEEQSWKIVTESGIELTVSQSTPIVIQTSTGYKVVDLNDQLLAERVPVLDNGEFRWELVVDLVDMGVLPVALLSADNGIYAAGNEPNRYIFTHNVMKVGQDQIEMF